MANATALSLLAADDHPGASVKWTVNIDKGRRQEASGDLVRERKRERWSGGDDEGMQREQGKRWREREFLPSPKATECALMHCGREHTVSPERERKSSVSHTMQSFHITTAQLFKKCQNAHTLACPRCVHTQCQRHGCILK